MRNFVIDVNKAILVLGMVLAHSIQFSYSGDNLLLTQISDYTNLVTFSGFYFCFGYVSWIAYLNGTEPPIKPMINTALKCYIAFIISGISFRLIIDNQNNFLTTLRNIIFLQDIPGYSEFLIAFSLITILAIIFHNQIRTLTKNGINLAITLFAISLFSIYRGSIQLNPVIELFIGGDGFSYFPVIQYSSLYILGIYFARNDIKYRFDLTLVSFLLVILFTFIKYQKIEISRFPPSILWIICSASLCYIYYLISLLFTSALTLRILKPLLQIGRNTLNYLLLSNIFIFFISKSIQFNRNSTITTFSIFLTTILVIYFLHSNIKEIKSKTK